jgi:hypothetical protein
MRVAKAHLPSCAAGLAALAAAAVTGCASSSSATGASGASPSPADPLSTVQLAAKSTSGVNSVTGTISVQATAATGAAASPAASGSTGSGALAFTGMFAEQVHPSLLASFDFQSLTSGGTSLPGGLSEVITPSTVYLKSPALTQAMRLSKPWLAIPLSQLGKSSGINFSQLLGGMNGSAPLSGSQLLAGATSVRQVGSSTLDGVPVTEYTGTLSLDKAIASLSGSAKSSLQQAITTAGFSTAKFTVWIDGKHTVRKSVVTEAGKTVTETTTTTITSINQPVNIAAPAASQTAPVPSGSGSLQGLS